VGENPPGALEALRGHLLTSDTLALGLPQGILVADGAIVVQDGRARFAAQVFDAAGRPLNAVGPEGAGPGEFVDPTSVFARPGNPGEFWIYDARLNRITPYDLASVRAGGSQPARTAIVLDPGLVVEEPRWLDDSTVVALNPMLTAGEGRFSLFGSDGKRRKTVGAPPPGSKDTPPFVRQQAYGGKLAGHPRHPVFVLASMYAGRLEVFNREGQLQRALQVPEPFEPDYQVAKDGLNMLWGKKFRYGYMDVAATDKHIYALFSGQQFEQEGAHLAAVVHVFEWSGRFLGALKLNAGATRLALDPSEKTLYVAQEEPYPQIMAYDLNSALPRLTAR
jgi:hypothetical protein